MMHAGRMPLEPGSRLDRYELLCPIAHGGMASVWLARFLGKHGFEKLVAIKTILPEFAADTRFQQMFLDEARIASGIEHVNVAQILDLGEQHEILYIVMEWVDGDSLSKLHRAVERRNERVPLGITLRLLADTCGGLHAAHELTDKAGHLLGVVHRDVSPQNVLVSSKGNAKLIDFGIAKALVRLSGETNAGLLKGKIQYMAPEQAMGRPLDRRADVWAAGACLYYLLAGVPPFDGENQLATLHLLTGGQPPPPLPGSVPESVRDVVSRALTFDPSRRTPTAADLQRQLEHAMISCGAYTTTSDVAAFVSRELGARADARKHAIDIALAAAASRSLANTSIMSTSDSANGTRAPVASSPMASTFSPVSQATGSASGHGTPAGNRPGASPHFGPSTMAATAFAPDSSHPMHHAHHAVAQTGEPESPISQVSNATLGAAAVAYPQGSVPPMRRPQRGGGPLMIGLLCAVAIAIAGSTAWYTHRTRSAAAAPPPSPVAQTSGAPTIASEPIDSAAASNSMTPIAPATGTSDVTVAASSRAVASATPAASSSAKAHAASKTGASSKPTATHTSTTTDYGF